MGLLNPSQMSHSDLYQARSKYPEQQNELAPYEHRAFAREWAQESPVMAGLSLPFAIPAYSIYKALGLSDSRSQPSLDEVIQGYKGLGEGLLGHFK
jgi:hypothetical protein